MNANFPAALSFVWQPSFDSPRDGYHVTPNDHGGGTKGGVIEATWTVAIARGLASGRLSDATDDALSAVLRGEFWGDACDALPAGLDLMLFNGRMMSGRYPWLFQQSLGFVGADVDGGIGPNTIGSAHGRDVETLIHALTGAHDAYLRALPMWGAFGHGWERRMLAARSLALELARS